MTDTRCPYCQRQDKARQSQPLFGIATALYCKHCGAILAILPIETSLVAPPPLTPTPFPPARTIQSRIAASLPPISSVKTAGGLPTTPVKTNQLEVLTLGNFITLIVAVIMFASLGVFMSIAPNDPAGPPIVIFAMMMTFSGLTFWVIIGTFVGVVAGTISGSVLKGIMVAHRLAIMGALMGGLFCGGVTSLLPALDAQPWAPTMAGTFLGVIIGLILGAVSGSLAWVMFRRDK